MVNEILLRNLISPKTNELEENIPWVCRSFGLVKGRDIEDTSIKIFNTLLHEFQKDSLISSESIARRLNIEPQRVNHHFRNFLETGFLNREKRKVVLRGGSMAQAVCEMKRDVDFIFLSILEVAKEIDKKLGFRH